MKKISILAAAAACSLAMLVPVTVLAGADPDTMNAQPQAKTTDSSIKASIKAQFATEKYQGFGMSHIDVDVNHHGMVSLEGTVPNQDAADRAVAIARATEGVRDVKNQLKVKSEP